MAVNMNRSIILASFVVTSLILSSARAQYVPNAPTELLENPGMEDSLRRDNWYCYCSMQRSSDAHMGLFSAALSSRSASWRNPSYKITDLVHPGRTYFFSAWIKITQQMGVMYDKINCQLQIDYQDGSRAWDGFGDDDRVQKTDGWHRVGGDFTVPSHKTIRKIRLYVKAPAGTDFLLDSTSLTEVKALPDDWREQADQRINQLRKSDLVLNIDLAGGIDPRDIEIRINMSSRHYPIGSAVKWWLMDNRHSEKNRLYQDFVYSTFNWATPEVGMKWGYTQEERNRVKYYGADRLVEKLAEHNVKVRGHAIVWGVPGHDPSWLDGLNAADLRTAVYSRIDSIVTRFAGSVEHWDVNNELLHGQEYEQGTGDVNITATMFDRAHQRDPDAKLFLNDYGCLGYGASTMAMVDHASRLLARGTTVHGIGLQSHLTAPPNIAAMKKHLDLLASSGLPLFVTEISYQQSDLQLRAQGYEDMFRLYFSHPAVTGMILWGFWDDDNWIANSAIVEGPTLEPNEAGERVLHLLRSEWQSHVTVVPEGASSTFTESLFHGEYLISVIRAGNVIQSQSVSVTQDTTLDLDVD